MQETPECFNSWKCQRPVEKYKKREKASFNRVESLITKKSNWDFLIKVSVSLVIIIKGLNALFSYPNLPKNLLYYLARPSGDFQLINV
ncbi:hypothetical protein Tery_0017 [Trichodesmium erythraeum IMS101]|uniref:Uncharacterized protein n=1 Tax=Trichodesmium erythraeum (strain IMS101) TaxID=203124 RepID=Q11AD3_TRIEI